MQLKNVKTLITHDNCPDGLATALIVKDALPNVEIKFVQYGTPEHLALEPKAGMLFCDFTPSVEREKTPAAPMTARGRDQAKAWADAGTIVLDHHKGAADLVAVFGENGVFADETKNPGVSGAALAFEHVWIPLRSGAVMDVGWHQSVKHFAGVAGVRDTWQKNDPRWQEACEQAAALMFWPRDLFLAEGVHNIASRLQIGPVLLQRDAERDAKSIKEAHRFTVGGVRVVCFEGTQTSDVAERLGDEADLIVGWHYFVEGGEQKIVFSNRSRGTFSCLDFAKRNGGGGHKNAAGFKLPVKSNATVSAQDYSPYEVVERLVTTHLEQQSK